MPRKTLSPQCNYKDGQTFGEWAARKSMAARLAVRLVERARMICKLLDGEFISKVASDLKVRSNTVIRCRNHFTVQGITGRYDRPCSGKPPKYDEEFHDWVLKTLKAPPPHCQSCWIGFSVARHLGASDDAVWRVLRKLNICLA